MNRIKERFIILITVPVLKQVPAYVLYLAEEIQKLGGTFYIAVNGEIEEKSRLRLENLCDQVVLRKNEDYDIGAYREIILGQINAGTLADYGQVVLMNDSFYGPFYPFTDVFAEMDGCGTDFWGLSAHPKTQVRDQYFIEEHLQSYFLVINRRMFQSSAFFQFWADLPVKISSRELAIECFEKKFTQYFSKRGYSWASYIDKDLFTNQNIRMNYNPYAYSALEMLDTCRFPVLKRSIIPLKSMEHFANWDDTRKCLQFIDEKTAYDMNLIWDDLLPRYDINMLKNYLHLNYIISSNQQSQQRKEDRNLLFIVHSLYKKENVPELIFQIGDVLRRDEFQSCSLQILAQYSYICFLNFSDIPEESCYCDQKTIRQNLIDNLIRDEGYISNVLHVFEENARLGILFAADPFFSEIFDSSRRREWKSRQYMVMQEAVKRKGLRSIVSDEWMPETGMGSFWCRADLFKTEKGFSLLKEILEPDAGALSERKIDTGLEQGTDWIGCLPYLCQHFGYLIGEILSDDAAALRLSNYNYAMSAIVDASFEIGGIQSKQLHDYHIQLCQEIMRPHIVRFCAQYGLIYIYGAGAYGVIFAQLLDQEHIDYEGFIVSRGQYKDETLLGKPVYYLDEVRVDADQAGILAAVPPQVQPVIQRLCSEKNYRNLYCFGARIANK